jgi:saccharopine dehydrogenase (NAD+, L-lysine-forming)
MRILLVGAGGVGDAFARIAARRTFFESLVVTDYDLSRAERTVASVLQSSPAETRLTSDRVDASDAASVADAARR